MKMIFGPRQASYGPASRVRFAPLAVTLVALACLIQQPNPAQAAQATEAPPAPTARPAGLSGIPAELAAWRTTLVFAERGDWDRALAVGGQADSRELRDVLVWLMLSDSDRPTDFETLADFLEAHPDWPGLRDLQYRAESLIQDASSPARRLAYFAVHPPITSAGRLAYLGALKDVGRTDEMAAEAKRLWRSIELSRGDEERFLEDFGQSITQQDHIDRLDAMLWRGKEGAARHMFDRVPDGWRKLADARIRLHYRKAVVDKALNAIPSALRTDPGLIYERARWRRKGGMTGAAREMMIGAPGDEEFQRLWWNERSWHAREALNEGLYSDAYLIAASHNQTRGIGFATGEWMAGWLALRFLNRPEDALVHFTAMHGNVGTPISLSRGAYWAGRAAQELGDDPLAATWYRRAAEHATTFYGQLAAAKLGETAPPLELDSWPSPDRIREFRESELVRVATALLRIGHTDMAERFLFAVNGQIEAPDHAMLLADLAIQAGLPKVAVFTARRSARIGATLIDRGYPIADLPEGDGPDPALVHAIIRQESSFDRKAISRVGARGLMQLMPATAKMTAASIDLPYRLGGLLSDPDYNMTLGRTYLGQMLDRFDGSYVMAIASYNAGPHRVDQWVKRNGDPRDPAVDIIDWIEKIPFSETRNYVQRVLEAAQVYRTKLPAAQNTLQAAVRRADAGSARDVWCVFACGRALDGGTQIPTRLVDAEKETGG